MPCHDHLEIALMIEDLYPARDSYFVKFVVLHDGFLDVHQVVGSLVHC